MKLHISKKIEGIVEPGIEIEGDVADGFKMSGMDGFKVTGFSDEVKDVTSKFYPESSMEVFQYDEMLINFKNMSLTVAKGGRFSIKAALMLVNEFEFSNKLIPKLQGAVIEYYNSIEGYVHIVLQNGTLGFIPDHQIPMVMMRLKHKYPEIKWTDRIDDYPKTFKATMLVSVESEIMLTEV